MDAPTAWEMSEVMRINQENIAWLDQLLQRAGRVKADLSELIPDLENVLTRLKIDAVSLAKLLPAAKGQLKAREAKASVLAIVGLVAQEFEYTPEEILGQSRSPQLALARQAAMYLARKYSSLSFPEIGDIFDRDHTTVIHGVKRVEQLRAQPRVAMSLRRLEGLIMQLADFER